MIARARCFLRQRHSPVRHPLGGFRCADCGTAGADLDEMGFPGGGWARVQRKVFDRTRREFSLPKENE